MVAVVVEQRVVAAEDGLGEEKVSPSKDNNSVDINTASIILFLYLDIF